MSFKDVFKETEMGLIPEDWDFLPIKEIDSSKETVQTGPFGSILHSHDYADEGVPLLLVKNIIDGKVVEDGIPKVDFEKANELKKFWLKKGDIVFTRVGAVGRTLHITEKEEGWMFSGQTLRLRIKNPEINNKFVEYYFRTPQYQSIIEMTSLGSTRASINTSILANTPIPVPPKAEQDKIAEIMFDLDQKIHLNHKMNKTLNDICQAIFRHWFVHFEFPNENGQPYMSSGGKMEDSEIGKIPVGWKVGKINDLIENPISGDWGKETSEGDFSERTFCIRGADIPKISISSQSKAPIRYIKPTKFKKCSLKDYDIVIEISGGSPTQSTGRAVLITNDILKRYENIAICSNFCKILRSTKIQYSTYLINLINQLYDKDFFFQYENGTTGIKNLDFKSLFNYEKIVIPPKNILDLFHSLIISNLNVNHNNGLESDTLTQIRNSLIPKLMSGKIRVNTQEETIVK